MYLETLMHTTTPVASAAVAAGRIKENQVTDHDALTWTGSTGRRLAVVADYHCNNPWMEVAVIDLDRNVQIESITAGWCDTGELHRYLQMCETTDYIMREF